MVRLDSGNVLLKPSQKRQLMNCLRRSVRLGQRIGNFLLTITMQRTGRQVELMATVKDRCGQFRCRSRARDLGNAMRELGRVVANRLHDQCLQRATVPA